ncbi:MAG TPA: glycine cleavage system protein H [Anaeromyxobacteraceae bacterium]|nr:glycine cleavage system protein H [Anaeromyxobacteraceae bacterium]
METIVTALQAIGIFVVGLFARVGLVVAVMAVLLVPVALVIAGARGWEALKMRLMGFRSAGGLRWRKGIHYAPGHTWVATENGRLRVGLDDLAQRILPWAISVELPRPGTRVAEGDTVATISCGGQEAPVVAPVDGLVVSVNPLVASDPSLVKRENYGRGWLFALEPIDSKRWLALPSGDAARSWLAAEGHRLTDFFEHQLGIAAADGGELVAPPPSLLGEAQWEALMRAFLKTK